MFDYPFPYYLSNLISHMYSPQAILAWIIFEYFVLKNSCWQRALLLLFLVIAINVFLKHLIGIPLQPPMVGYAVPSGHTQAAFAFWGYISYSYREKFFSYGIIALLMIFCWSLVHRHYHNWFDIASAIMFFVLELSIFEYLYYKRRYFVLEAFSLILLALYLSGFSWFPTVSFFGITTLLLSERPDRCTIYWIIGLWLFCLSDISFESRYFLLSACLYVLLKLAHKNTSNELSNNY